MSKRQVVFSQTLTAHVCVPGEFSCESAQDLNPSPDWFIEAAGAERKPQWLPQPQEELASGM